MRIKPEQEAFIDFFLDVLVTAERMRRNPDEPRLAFHDSIELPFFRKAHWFGNKAIESGALHWAATGEAQREFFTDVTPQDVPQWDSVIIRDGDLQPDSEDEDLVPERLREVKARFQCTRYRRVPMSDLRGRFKVYSPIISEASVCTVYENDEYVTTRVWHQYVDGHWMLANPTVYSGGAVSLGRDELEYSEYDEERVKLALSMQLTHYYYWFAEFGIGEHQFSVMLPLSPGLARHVFKLRDIQKGHTRRSAILNWVNEYWRAVPSQEDEDVLVREYLRGVKSFEWLGLTVSVHPSPEILARISKAASFKPRPRRLHPVRRAR